MQRSEESSLAHPSVRVGDQDWRESGLTNQPFVQNDRVTVSRPAVEQRGARQCAGVGNQAGELAALPPYRTAMEVSHPSGPMKMSVATVKPQVNDQITPG